MTSAKERGTSVEGRVTKECRVMSDKEHVSSDAIFSSTLDPRPPPLSIDPRLRGIDLAQSAKHVLSEIEGDAKGK